ncbi:MAG TPA: FTR1 family protein [Candidatus Kapabacteria bacterium]|nr:FTR1 family protein [Candidatus Kapabacteria bacterium]
MSFEMFLQQFVIAFREGIEASLLVATILIALRQRNANELKQPVWTGVWAAIILCLIGGFLLFKYAIGASAHVELALYAAAAVTVTSMIFWMHKTGKQIRSGVYSKIDSLKGQATFAAKAAMFAFVFFMVAREGVELMLLLMSFAAVDGGWSLILAIVLGLGTSIGIGYTLTKGLVKINVGQFLQWTAYVLVLFVLQIINDILHEGMEIGVFSISGGLATTIDYLSHELPIFAYAGLILFAFVSAYTIAQARIANRKAALEAA